MQNEIYHLRTEISDGEWRYFAAFEDGNGSCQEIEVSSEVYMALDDCRKSDQRQLRFDERHVEQSLLSDEQLTERVAIPPVPLDEIVSLSLDWQAALSTLTATQCRRFLLHHEHGLSNMQIATVEGCSERAIKYSISAAKEQIKNFFESDLPFLPSECGNK